MGIIEGDIDANGVWVVSWGLDGFMIAKQFEHGEIIAIDLGPEGLEAAFPGDVDHILEEDSGHAEAPFIFPDDEGHFGAFGIAVEVVTADGVDDLSRPLELEYAEGEVSILVDTDQFEGPFAGHAGDGKAIAADDGFLGMGVEEILKAAIISGGEGAEEVFAVIAEGDALNGDGGGLGFNRGRELEVGGEEVMFAGAAEEILAEIGMSDLD